jgi:hypothetical protein
MEDPVSTTIYLVSAGEDADYGVIKGFGSREGAEAFAADYNSTRKWTQDAARVEELDLVPATPGSGLRDALREVVREANDRFESEERLGRAYLHELLCQLEGLLAPPVARRDVTVHSTQVGVLRTQVGVLRGESWHIEVRGNHYVVSAADIPRESAETSVFPADSAGLTSTLLEVASVEGFDHEAAIADLLRRLNNDAPSVGSGQR